MFNIITLLVKTLNSEGVELLNDLLIVNYKFVGKKSLATSYTGLAREGCPSGLW